jgi:hypothetical protein
MIEPHPIPEFEGFFKNTSSVVWNGSPKGIFGEGGERKVSDICYSFIGFSDFM